jgi:hypothetical protein
VNTVRWQLRIFLVTLAAIFGTTATIAQTQLPYQNEISIEANWITLKAQASCSGSIVDGAIGQSAFPAGGTQIVDAYRGNFAALGLLAAGPAYYSNVERWATWYMKNINWPDATIYYYSVDANSNPCTETASDSQGNTAKPTYDAQDSWAATYLTLIAAWAQADRLNQVDSGSKSFIITWAYQLDAIANAAYAMVQPSGLTGATSGDTIQYLMDNSEVVQGLNSYVWIVNNMLPDNDATTNKKNYWPYTVAPINAAIQSALWEQCGGSKLYCDAYGDPQHSWVACKSDTEQPTGSDYEYFWDTGLTGEAQVWPTFAGMMMQNDASIVFGNLKTNCPTWATAAGLPSPSTPEYPLLSDSGIALAAAISGGSNTADAVVWMNQANSFWMQNHQWPWTVFDAGNAIRTANILNGKSDPAITCPNSDCTTVANSPQ